MNYSTFLFFISLLLVSCNTKSTSPKVTEQPNFIIIQADDLGWDDLPLNGNSYAKTPKLDKLAASSLKINRFYVNPVCAPSRASLLTGRDFLLTGVSHVHGGKDFLNLNETTFGSVFQNEGYQTGIWGKWHSGTTEGYFPWQRGFNEAYMAKLYKHKNSEGSFNGKPVKFNKWTEEVIVDYAINFVKKNQNVPFVAYLSFLTVHEPLIAREKIIKRYRKQGLSENLATIYAMIEQMDAEIGRLLKEISNLGLDKNTYIIFMSDNGPAILNNYLNESDRDIRYSSNYKGHKGNIWENGVKSPLLISHPKKLKAAKISLLSDVSDIFPTIAELAGIDISKYQLNLTGKSFAKNLLQESYNRPDKIVFNYANIGWPPTNTAWSPKGVNNEYLPIENNKELTNYEPQIMSIIKGDYKLLKNPSRIEATIGNKDNYALISIAKDTLENYNISTKNEELFITMKEILQKKYISIINSKNSFKPIIFNLDSASANNIYLYAPSKIGDDLGVGYNFSYPWNTTKCFASYNVKSTITYTATPTIIKKGNTSNITYLLNINGIKSKSIYQNENEIVFEKIKISKGESIIHISVIASPSSNKNNEIHFKELILQ